MLMKKILFAALIAGVVCNTWAGKNTRVPIEFSAVEYNSVASRYMERPTFSEVDKKFIYIYVEKYGVDEQDKIFTSKKSAYSHIDLLEKYLKWENIAAKDGDLVDKKIGKTKSAGGLKYQYYFHSGNADKHYLIVTPCLFGCIDEQAVVFDKAGAIGLRSLLQSYANGEVKEEVKESKYN